MIEPIRVRQAGRNIVAEILPSESAIERVLLSIYVRGLPTVERYQEVVATDATDGHKRWRLERIVVRWMEGHTARDCETGRTRRIS